MAENILTVDVEEIFHTEYARHTDRVGLSFRTPENIQYILDFLGNHNVSATFFVVGEIAEIFPEVIELIEANGHEVAFHGWSHLPLMELNVASFKKEITRFRKNFPQCIGYRAPSFSLSNDTRWALKVLQENEFYYDSSIFPARTPLYGVSEAPMCPYIPSMDDITKKNDNGFIFYEFPLAVYGIFGLRIPIAGGFWLRFWDPRLINKGVRKLNEKGLPAVMFVHSWELDPDTPKLRLSPYRSFVTYHNREKTITLLEHLLNTFPFTSFSKYLKSTDII